MEVRSFVGMNGASEVYCHQAIQAFRIVESLAGGLPVLRAAGA
jgi:hypothetical protein